MSFRCLNGQCYYERIPLSQNITYKVFKGIQLRVTLAQNEAIGQNITPRELEFALRVMVKRIGLGPNMLVIALFMHY